MKVGSNTILSVSDKDKINNCKSSNSFKFSKINCRCKLTGCIIHNDSGHYGILLNNLKKIILKNEFIDRKFLNFALILKSKFQEQKKGNSSKVLSTVCQPF